LDNYGWNAVFCSIIFSAALAMIPALFLKETRLERTKTRFRLTGPSRKSSDTSFLRVLIIFLMFTTFRGAEMAFSQITPIYLSERFNASSYQQGLFFCVGTMVANLIIQLPAGWLADRYSRRKIALISAACEPFIIVLWPYMSSYWSLLALRMLL